VNHSRFALGALVAALGVCLILPSTHARDGVSGARQRSYLTVAGVIQGAQDQPRLRFTFGVRAGRQCPPVMATEVNWTQAPAFSAQVNVEGPFNSGGEPGWRSVEYPGGVRTLLRRSSERTKRHPCGAALA